MTSETALSAHPDDGHDHWFACVRCGVDNGINDARSQPATAPNSETALSAVDRLIQMALMLDPESPVGRQARIADVARSQPATEPSATDYLAAKDRSAAEHSDTRSDCPRCGEWRDSPTSDCANCAFAATEPAGDER